MQLCVHLAYLETVIDPKQSAAFGCWTAGAFYSFITMAWANAAMEHTPTTTLTHLLMNEIKLLHLSRETKEHANPLLKLLETLAHVEKFLPAYA